MSAIIPLSERPFPKTICMFDVDGTLSPARLHASDATLKALAQLRTKCATAFVGGSNLVKIEEQLENKGVSAVDQFDYGFAENGLTAYKLGKPLASQSFIKFLGEDKYKLLSSFILHYIADMDVPVKRGTFIEFRNGMINVSPVGRNASTQERNDFEAWDKTTAARAKFIEALKEKFPDYGLTYSIGGQISFDVFPHGWDKTYSLNHIEPEGFETIHFFGDKTYKGGNDYEIFTDSRTTGHTVTCQEDTVAILEELFNLSGKQ